MNPDLNIYLMRNCSFFFFKCKGAFFSLFFELVASLSSHLHTLVAFMRLRLKEQVNTTPTNHAECTQHDFTEMDSCWHRDSTAKRLQRTFKGLLQTRCNLRSQASVKSISPEYRTHERMRKMWFKKRKKILFLEQIVHTSGQKKAIAKRCVQQTVEISY